MQETRKESFTVEGNQVIEKIRQLIREGNVRHIVVRRGSRTIVEFPVTVGVIGTVLAPALAAIGVVAALLTECTIEVQRTAELSQPTPEGFTPPGEPPVPPEP